jgi:YggT family protein
METHKIVLTILRYVVFGVVAITALIALGSGLVRSRRVSPFGVLGRTLRSVTDPILRPVERRLVRMGGNPGHAGGWLVVVTAIAGVVVLSLVGWLLMTLQTAQAAATRGPRATFSLIIDIAYRILIVALVVRVIATWFGLFRYSRWVRPAYLLTDWIVEPIRRVVPPLGAMDVSPIVAWFALMLLRQLLFAMLTI